MKSRNTWILAFALVATLGLVIVLPLTPAFSAGTTVVVTPPVNSQGWSIEDTRPGGGVSFVVDGTAPSGGCGALQLTTDVSTTAKAQYLHATNTPLVNVTELSYYTKQVSALFAGGDPSYQLVTCLDGVSGTTCNGFTTFVYEPYENGVVIPSTWQSWDVDAGQMWSSRTYSSGTCTVAAGFGGAPFYTLAGLQAACPNAVVVGFGVNIGSNNPGYNVYADLVNFNGTTYDFEPDSDGDGVSDCLDNCPTVSNPGQANFDGDATGDVCDSDDDNDGVADNLDLCPGTAPGTTVNTTGCPLVTNSDQCKNGGWVNLYRANGTPFKNQGDCVSYTKNGK